MLDFMGVQSTAHIHSQKAAESWIWNYYRFGILIRFGIIMYLELLWIWRIWNPAHAPDSILAKKIVYIRDHIPPSLYLEEIMLRSIQFCPP